MQAGQDSDGGGLGGLDGMCTLYAVVRLSLSLGDEFGTLECLFRSNVIIRRAHKAIQGDDCRPRRRS
jgi:hypothetical protein